MTNLYIEMEAMTCQALIERTELLLGGGGSVNVLFGGDKFRIVIMNFVCHSNAVTHFVYHCNAVTHIVCHRNAVTRFVWHRNAVTCFVSP